MEGYDPRRPEWKRWDTVRSLRDLGSVALDALVQLIPINCEIIIDEPNKREPDGN